jgi:hypothetical protein
MFGKIKWLLVVSCRLSVVGCQLSVVSCRLSVVGLYQISFICLSVYHLLYYQLSDTNPIIGLNTDEVYS